MPTIVEKNIRYCKAQVACDAEVLRNPEQDTCSACRTRLARKGRAVRRLRGESPTDLRYAHRVRGA